MPTGVENLNQNSHRISSIYHISVCHHHVDEMYIHMNNVYQITNTVYLERNERKKIVALGKIFV